MTRRYPEGSSFSSLEPATTRVVAASAGLAALLTVSACSSPAATRTDPSGPATVSLVIGGRDQSLRGDVSCSSHSGGFVIRVGQPPGGIFVVLKAGAEQQVDSVDLGNSTGTALVSHDATVTTTDGAHYVIIGDAVPESDKTTANTKPFELKVDCSQ